MLREETEILHESLSQFSDWVQQKISVLEEDMDLCRIVYSLHGSLSKVILILCFDLLYNIATVVQTGFRVGSDYDYNRNRLQLIIIHAPSQLLPCVIFIFNRKLMLMNRCEISCLLVNHQCKN